MKAQEFITERWTAKTVKSYFDSQQNNKLARVDFTISRPFDHCIMFRFKTVPDLTRAFFRMAEFYEGNRYKNNASRNSGMADFLDNFVDRSGNVNYFKFWDGFNITDTAFYNWIKSAGSLAQAEQLIVDTVKKQMKTRPFSIIGVAEHNTATDNHELFHALYYLQPEYRQLVDELMKEFRQDTAYKRMSQTLKKKLQYSNHIDEEVAAYLTAGSQLKMVFDVNPREFVAKFGKLFRNYVVEAAEKKI